MPALLSLLKVTVVISYSLITFPFAGFVIAQHVSVSLSFPVPQPTIGDYSVVQCTVILPERFTTEPDALELIYFGDIAQLSSNIRANNITRNQTTFTRDIIFDPLYDGNVSPYHCVATVKGMNKMSNIKTLTANGKFSCTNIYIPYIIYTYIYNIYNIYIYY